MPPTEMKSCRHWPIALAGLIVGTLVSACVFYLLYYRTVQLAAAPLPEERVRTDLTPAQIESATTLVPGKQLLGTVTATGKNSIELTVTVPNLLDPSKSATTSVTIAFDPSRDSIIAVKQGANGSVTRDTKATLSDIGIGTQVLIAAGTNGNAFYVSK